MSKKEQTALCLFDYKEQGLLNAKCLEAGLKQKDVVPHAKGVRFLDIFAFLLCKLDAHIYFVNVKTGVYCVIHIMLRESHELKILVSQENIMGLHQKGVILALSKAYLYGYCQCGYCASCSLYPPCSDSVLLFLKIRRAICSILNKLLLSQ